MISELPATVTSLWNTDVPSTFNVLLKSATLSTMRRCTVVLDNVTLPDVTDKLFNVVVPLTAKSVRAPVAIVAVPSTTILCVSIASPKIVSTFLHQYLNFVYSHRLMLSYH